MSDALIISVTLGILLLVSIVINILYYCKSKPKPNGVLHDNFHYQASPNYKVKPMHIPKDDKVFQFFDQVLRIQKEDTSNIDVNTRIVREFTQVLSPLTASFRDVLKLHAILAQMTPISMSLFSKLTVFYSLVARGIKLLGTKKHLAILASISKNKQLGCFALTEFGAGTQTGIIIETETNWNDDKKCFILNTPNKQARKKWIGQARTADYMIVISKLYYQGKNCGGVRAFLINMDKQTVYRGKNGQTGFIDGLINNTDGGLKGMENCIIIEDVPSKNCARGVDNGIIHFNNVILDKGPSFLKTMSSLSTGRVFMAVTCIEYLKQCYIWTNDYLTNKRKIYINRKDLSKQCGLIEFEHISNNMNKIKFWIEKMDDYLKDVIEGYANKMPEESTETMEILYNYASNAGKYDTYDNNSNNDVSEVKLLNGLAVQLEMEEKQGAGVDEKSEYDSDNNNNDDIVREISFKTCKSLPFDKHGIDYAFLKKINVCKAYFPILTLEFLHVMRDLIGVEMYSQESPLFMIERVATGRLVEGDCALLLIKLAADQLKYNRSKNWKQLKFKFQAWKNANNLDEWYVNNTDSLITLGMEICVDEILEIKYFL